VDLLHLGTSGGPQRSELLIKVRYDINCAEKMLQNLKGAFEFPWWRRCQLVDGFISEKAVLMEIIGIALQEDAICHKAIDLVLQISRRATLVNTSAFNDRSQASRR
jgi:hypothetical protein